MKKSLIILMIVVTVFGMCVGCGKSENSGTVKDTLAICGDDITTFNPYNTVNGPDIYFMMHVIGESLVRCNNKFEYVPLLAESYKRSEDGLSYTFNLRKGVTFHDGSTLDSADVKYSIESAMNGMTASILGQYITSIDTPDDLTVVVNFNSYMDTFLMTLSSYVPIMPSGIFESGYDFDSHPIGTGPYEFVSYTPGDSLKLKKYTSYYDGNCASFENISYRVMTDLSTAFVSLETGDIDFLRIAASDVPLVEKNKDLKIDTYSTYSTVLGWMDNSVAPFDDINVRRALNHAIDRNTLASIKNDLGFSPASTYVTPCCYGYSSDFKPYAYDVELAKKLLSESKYKPEEISFKIATTDEFKTEAQYLQESFRNVGIQNVSVDIIEPSTFQSGIMTKQYPFGISTVGCGLSATSASLLFSSQSPVNMMSYNNPEVDECYATADTTLDEKERLSALHRIDELIINDAPYIPLLWCNDIIAYRSNISIEHALEFSSSTSAVMPQYVEIADK